MKTGGRHSLSTAKSNSSSTSKKSPLSTPPPSASGGAPGKPGVLLAGEHEHNHLSWLVDDNVRKDRKGHKVGDDRFDARTVLVPQGYLDGKSHFAPGCQRKITPALRLWWEFKSQFFDTLLFFKVGKFYEIYHMDADVAVKHVGLTYMKGDTAHCGFPEKAYGKFSEQLVSLGYRVARIEQTETPDEQKKRTGKASGPVRREICGILSAGTRMLEVRDGFETIGAPGAPTQLAAIFENPEKLQGDQDGNDVEFGVCVLDSTTGKFSLGSFKDKSSNLTQLRMFLARERPAEVVYGLDNLDLRTQTLVKQACPSQPGCSGSVVHSQLPSGVAKSASQQAEKTLSKINNANPPFFPDGLPQTLREMLTAEKKCLPERAAALGALGVCLQVLGRSLIDRKLLTMNNFSLYELPGNELSASSPDATAADPLQGKKMVLDSQAIFNLDLLGSSASGQEDGSLLHFLDRCMTKFGRRQLRNWVAAPLQSASDIRARQALVVGLVDLQSHSDCLSNIRSLLKTVPDMERMLMRVHSNAVKDEDHPDSRAVLYEFLELNREKIKTLVLTLKGARLALKVMETLKKGIEEREIDAGGDDSVKATLLPLRKLCDAPFAEWAALLDDFSRSFDAKEAETSGAVEPIRGANHEYDQAQDRVSECRAAFDEDLARVKEYYQGKGNVGAIKFFSPNSGKDLYQIEIPEQLLSKRNPPTGLKMKTKSKGVTRFHSDAIVKKVGRLAAAEAKLEETKADATRMVYEAFDVNRQVWNQLLSCIRDLDCLLSLALVSSNSCEESPMCVPDILDAQDGQTAAAPVLELEEARHPCVAAVLERQGKSYIPNDMHIGGENKPTCLLLTGPNMGGKSSLCRQTAIAIVMAQIGCFVNAKAMRITPVDRIFTRLGASDFIMSGQSTFFVELDETATVLHHASRRSLVILDELGRGTSTHDGAAIAYAVVEHLLKVGARTLFATHYHALVKDFEGCPSVATGHMACFASGSSTSTGAENGSAEKPKAVDITFLYKLADGPSDKSHGLNVARLAKLPESIISTAQRESLRFERDFLAEQLYSELQTAIKNKADGETLHKLWHRAKQLVL